MKAIDGDGGFSEPDKETGQRVQLLSLTLRVDKRRLVSRKVEELALAMVMLNSLERYASLECKTNRRIDRAMKIRLRSNCGTIGIRAAYTLVEVVIAVAVVTVLFVSLYIGLSFGFAMTESNREDLRATQIILERMEGIRLFTFEQLDDPVYNPRSFTNYFYPLAVGSQSKGIAYFGTLQVLSNLTLNPVATYGNNMKKVSVTINWTSGSAVYRRTMSTYVSRHGVQNYIYGN